ncbi:MAG: molybdopterin cofactor-binding domain-containing protein [Gemmatimonadales bacterium]
MKTSRSRREIEPNGGISRRHFVVIVTAAAGALLLNCRWSPDQAANQAEPETALGAWLRIGADDRITIILSQAEMGQGVYTSLPVIIADELGADWSRVRVENSPTAEAYRNPKLNWQFTGGAESVRSFYDHLRKMGATAREMLIAVAARRWNVDRSSCRTEGGVGHHVSSRRRLRFGALAAEAAQVPPPADPPLRPREDFRLIGKRLPRLDTPSKVDGSAVFGLDVTVPGMVHAAIRAVPEIGASFAPFDAEAVRRGPGVIDVITLPDGAVAVVAQTYWQARRALGALPLAVESGPHRGVNSDDFIAAEHAAAKGSRAVTFHSAGNPSLTLARAARRHEAEYRSPFEAHATMEPMNCTAQVTADGVDIWGPTQGQELAQVTVAAVLGLAKDKVRVNRTFLGGGFGRRLLADFVVQTVLLARRVGRPVKLIWSREEDMQHDFYRPAVVNRLSGGLDARGALQVLRHRVVSPTILLHVYPAAAEALKEGKDDLCMEGARELPYRVPHQLADFTLMTLPIPTSVWRTTGYGPNVFAIENFLDELAHLSAQDPYRFRHRLLQHDPRALAVLELAAAGSAWDTPPAPGRARGLAFAAPFGSYVAQVVELSVTGQEVKVHRVICAVDCGQVISPDTVVAQMESGVAWSLTAATRTEITFDQGRITQSNFHDFPVLRLPEMPAVEVHLVDSGEPPGGVGEVGAVPTAPALTNALFAATGRRIRTLPLIHHGFRLV